MVLYECPSLLVSPRAELGLVPKPEQLHSQSGINVVRTDSTTSQPFLSPLKPNIPRRLGDASFLNVLLCVHSTETIASMKAASSSH